MQLAHTLRLVRPPVVWVVVEPAADAPATAEVLRGTGVLYRHRLAGVLHFADAAGVYDVGFFDQIRQIELVPPSPPSSNLTLCFLPSFLRFHAMLAFN